VRRLINVQVSDLINTSLDRIGEMNINSVAELEGQKNIMIDFSKDMNEKRAQLKNTLNRELYRHYRVIRMSSKASRFLKTLFQIYCDNPEQLPPQAFEKIGKRGKYQVICDYVAGMTDRYALDQYKKLMEPYERV
jgi:dGTPase